MLNQKIRVSKRSIREGVQEECLLCPVALAVRKALRVPVGRVVVDSNTIIVNDYEGLAAYQMPCSTRVKKFISRFDKTFEKGHFFGSGRRVHFKKDIQPINFILNLQKIDNV